MARKGSGSSGHRSMFVDLDAALEVVPAATNVSVDSGSSNPSSSNMSKRKNQSNPDMPPHEYVLEARAIAVIFYA